MTTIARILIIGALSAAPTALWAQGQGRAGEQRPAPGEQRREQLMQQIHDRFMSQAASRLGLDAGQREKLDDVLARGMAARRYLAQESQSVRMALMRAVRSDSADEATFRKLVDQMEALRSRERALEDRETRELSSFLDARQQAMFLVMRMQFNDRVQRMRGGMQGGRGGPGGMSF